MFTLFECHPGLTDNLYQCNIKYTRYYNKERIWKFNELMVPKFELMNYFVNIYFKHATSNLWNWLMIFILSFFAKCTHDLPNDRNRTMPKASSCEFTTIYLQTCFIKEDVLLLTHWVSGFALFLRACLLSQVGRGTEVRHVSISRTLTIECVHARTFCRKTWQTQLNYKYKVYIHTEEEYNK